MPVITNTNSLRAGIIDAVAETWRQQMPVFEKLQSLLLYNLPYTNLRKADYVWKNSIPFPKKWSQNKGRTYQTFQDVLISVTLMPFELSIPFNYYDMQDDQLGDLKTHVSVGIKRFFMLADKLQSEFFNGAAILNDTLPNSYDGAALFSATDGDGANRLGVAGGNIITGSGLSVDGVINDVASAQRRFLDMLDPAGEFIYQEADVDYSKLCVIGPNEANEILQRASKSEYIRIDPANVVSESNYQVGTWEYKINPYLANANDLFVVVRDTYWKPFVYRQPSGDGIRSIFADFSNSDRAREFNEEALLADVRVGITPWFIGSIIRINNS